MRLSRNGRPPRVASRELAHQSHPVSFPATGHIHRPRAGDSPEVRTVLRSTKEVARLLRAGRKGKPD
eukprot:scaffold138340_cov28-Tisochrysis_lutea.AAC.5